MDKHGIIGKAHNKLLASLTSEEKAIFGELTQAHQRFIVGWLVHTDENEFPDDEPIETTIRTDIESCIGHIKDNIRRISATTESREEWELWLGLKNRVRKIMDIQELARLLFTPYDIKAGNDNRLTLQDTAESVMAGFWVTEGYMEPYLYPWQTAMRRILFKKGELPAVDVWTPQERRMFYGELPTEKKIYAQIHIDGLTVAAKEMRPWGRMHPAKFLPVWQSYLPSEPHPSTEDKREELREIYQEMKQKLGRYAGQGLLLRSTAEKAECSVDTVKRALGLKK